MSYQSYQSMRLRQQLSKRYILQGIFVALCFIGASVFILVYRFSKTDIINLQLGDVAPKDIVASQQFSYISTTQTEAERDQVRTLVATIYSPPDPKVARQQIDYLRKIFDYLEAVRADPYGSLAEKSEWVTAIPDLSLSDTVVDQILIMIEEDWTETSQEARAILNQAMRTEIRESQVLSTRRQLPTLVALDTPDEQASVIVAVIEDLIKPNAFPDETRTEVERQTQADLVAPIEITIEENELIIPAGEIVREADLEALEVLNALQEPELNRIEDLVGPIVLMILTTLFLSTYLFQYAPRVLVDSKRLIILSVLVLLFIAVAKFMIPTSSFVHLYPIAALTMLVVTLLEVQVAFILNVFLALIAGYIATENPQEVFIYLVLSGWTGVLALGGSQRVTDFLRAGVYVGLVNIGVIAIFNLPLLSSDTTRLGILMAVGFLNGVILSAALALVGLLAIGSLAGITTSIQLSDLVRPTHPLQRQLLLKAPGTYHHSLMVGNLGEQAAERIGADSLLVRVMAYYHDIGKTQRPYFFAENQPHGINVHEKLEPQISAQIIISHVSDGLELAKKYRLPLDIQAGIAQHHGSDLVKYFYYQALKAAEEKNIQVDENHFHYPGPKPQTKEIGILMLADISESTVRALKPGSAEEIDEIVEKMIADKISNGQLDECDLTISDLHHIRRAFVDILQGVHHPRIKYPEQIKAEEQKAQEKLSEEKSNSENEMMPPKSPTPSVAASHLQPASVKSVRPTPLVRRE